MNTKTGISRQPWEISLKRNFVSSFSITQQKQFKENFERERERLSLLLLLACFSFSSSHLTMVKNRYNPLQNGRFSLGQMRSCFLFGKRGLFCCVVLLVSLTAHTFTGATNGFTHWRGRMRKGETSEMKKWQKSTNIQSDDGVVGCIVKVEQMQWRSVGKIQG